LQFHLYQIAYAKLAQRVSLRFEGNSTPVVAAVWVSIRKLVALFLACYIQAMKKLLITLLLVGCANPYISSFLLPLEGTQAQPQIVERFGVPDKTVSIGDKEVWEYTLNEESYTSSTGYNFSTGDVVEITFENGVLVSWEISSL